MGGLSGFGFMSARLSDLADGDETMHMAGAFEPSKLPTTFGDGNDEEDDDMAMSDAAPNASEFVVPKFDFGAPPPFVDPDDIKFVTPEKVADGPTSATSMATVVELEMQPKKWRRYPHSPRPRLMFRAPKLVHDVPAEEWEIVFYLLDPTPGSTNMIELKGRRVVTENGIDFFPPDLPKVALDMRRKTFHATVSLEAMGGSRCYQLGTFTYVRSA